MDSLPTMQKMEILFWVNSHGDKSKMVLSAIK